MSNQSHMETAISVTTGLIEARNVMRRFHGENYAARVEPFREAIRDRVSHGMGVAAASADVIKIAEAKLTAMDQALALAAAAEEMGNS